VASVADPGKAAIDPDVARVLKWVGVFDRVRAGLVDCDEDVIEVRLGPRQGFQPRPEAVADDRHGRGFGVDDQLQTGRFVRRISSPSSASARRS
jgi:hypothetical protein